MFDFIKLKTHLKYNFISSSEEKCGTIFYRPQSIFSSLANYFEPFSFQRHFKTP